MVTMVGSAVVRAVEASAGFPGEIANATARIAA
jgi:hypothetical protein